MKADYCRFWAETKRDKDRQDMIEKTQNAYTEAMKQAYSSLGANHPTRMALVLNYAIFLFEVVEDKEKACRVADKAHDDFFGSQTSSISLKEIKEAELILQLLKQHVAMWEYDEDDEFE
eukprot:CAMPEP_0168527026 /NCGR_PEP_ID=MMETSP0405-20121227/12342_1 /TAXON_ID=498012 /ORGANISM="Trichosphaerium sp, Strain Am-I-7 wt" /LENGTH=118 /DNA_ID=CAMNT_0008550029 /DNA_START=355 /DNA_END=711 /DNA_ORIENTATION=-